MSGKGKIIRRIGNSNALLRAHARPGTALDTAMGEDAALQEGVELVLDELREVGTGGSFGPGPEDPLCGPTNRPPQSRAPSCSRSVVPLRISRATRFRMSMWWIYAVAAAVVVLVILQAWGMRRSAARGAREEKVRVDQETERYALGAEYGNQMRRSSKS